MKTLCAAAIGIGSLWLVSPTGGGEGMPFWVERLGWEKPRSE